MFEQRGGKGKRENVVAPPPRRSTMVRTTFSLLASFDSGVATKGKERFTRKVSTGLTGRHSSGFGGLEVVSKSGRLSTRGIHISHLPQNEMRTLSQKGAFFFFLHFLFPLRSKMGLTFFLPSHSRANVV